MKIKYQGFLSVYKVSTKYHGEVYVNAFTEDEAISKVKEFIKETAMYNRYGEGCFEGMKASHDKSYDFILI